MALLKIAYIVCALTACAMTVPSAHAQPAESVTRSNGFPMKEEPQEQADGMKSIIDSLATLSKEMSKMAEVVSKLAHDHCKPNPCENGGRCIDQDNGAVCFCEDGFTGDNCSISQRSFVPKSCQEIYSKGERASGKYKIDADGRGSVQVYCDMTAGGGWMRIVNINASRNRCPNGFSRITNPLTVCTLKQGGGGCISAHFGTHGVAYSEVRGYAYGNQYGSPDAFYPGQSTSINGAYVDGISVTYGTPRQHVWTYAIGMFQNKFQDESNCPCARYPGHSPPSFVGNDYYCDSGVEGNEWRHDWYSDRLWDGHCHYRSHCCSRSSMPFFVKNIGTTTTAPLEVRLCQDSPTSDENIGLHQMELFIR